MKKKTYQKTTGLVLAAFLFLGCQLPADTGTNSGKSYADYFKNLPFEMEPIALPQFPDASIDIRDMGGKGDGVTDNTDAINEAIRKISSQGGGRVIIPAGIWLTGPVQLLDNVNLHAESNALVIFDPNPARYPIIKTSFEGLNTRRSISPISARNAQNIAITGEGVFDGSGDAWRPVKKEKMTDTQWRKLLASGGVVNEAGNIWFPSEQSYRGSQVSDMFNNPENLQTDEEWEAIHQWLRPVFVSIVSCENVWLDGVTFRNSPAWSLHPLSCTNVVITNVKVFNPWYSQNGDALDLESCHNALIADNLFDAGDDGICIKSGKDKDGRDRNEPCENVVIRNNVVLHGHGGFVVGSEMSGGVRNIYVVDCTFTGTDVGLRFKSTRGRGGVVENIWIENIMMSEIVTEPLLFDLFYMGKSAVEELDDPSATSTAIPPVTEETPAFRNIHIKDVYCKNARRAMYFNGLPEMKIENVDIRDVVITSTMGAELVNARNVNMQNVTILNASGNKFTIRESENISINDQSFTEVGKNAITLD